jgi:hypothetical protein
VSQIQKQIIGKELKTPKRPKYKPQNNKPEHTHKTQNQNTQIEIARIPGGSVIFSSPPLLIPVLGPTQPHIN